MSVAHNQLYARPYAEAAFEYAKAHGAVSAWHEFLNSFAQAFIENHMQSLLGNPLLDSAQLIEAISAALHNQLDPGQINFLQLLAKNHRLIYLSAIAQTFSTLRDADEEILRVTVRSAFALDTETQTRLKQKLTDQFKKNIVMNTEITPELIGGLTIQIGDRVLDLSIQNKLSQLIQSLSGSSLLRDHTQG